MITRRIILPTIIVLSLLPDPVGAGLIVSANYGRETSTYDSGSDTIVTDVELGTPQSASKDLGTVSVSQSKSWTNPFEPPPGEPPLPPTEQDANATATDHFQLGAYTYGEIPQNPLQLKLSVSASSGSGIVSSDAEIRVKKRFRVVGRNGAPLGKDQFLGKPVMYFEFGIDGFFSHMVDDEMQVPRSLGFLQFDNLTPDFDGFDPVFNDDGDLITDTGFIGWNTTPYFNLSRAPNIDSDQTVFPGPNYFDFYERDRDDDSTSWHVDVAGNPAYPGETPYVTVFAPIVVDPDNPNAGTGTLHFSVRAGVDVRFGESLTANFGNTISLTDFSIGGIGALSNPDLFAERYSLEFLPDDPTTGPTTSAVPEPTSLALFGCGALGIIGVVRRRKKSNAASAG